MLLGEQFGRRHHRGLIVVLDREQRGEQGDDRLAAAHVALQQAVHALRARHVLHDLARGAHLRAGELERQDRLQFRGQHALVHEPDFRAGLAGERLGAQLQDVHAQQFLEREARAARMRLGEGARTVHGAQRVRQRGHSGGRQQVWRDVFLEQRQVLIEMLVDQCAQLLERESLGRRIHGEHATPARAVCRVLRPQVHELARRQHATVEEAHRAGEQQHVALLDGAVEEGLARPRCLDEPARVLHHGLKHAKTLSRGNHALRDHGADDRGVVTDTQFRDGGHRARVLVPVRDVQEEVARRENTEPPERVGARGPDAGEVRDRGVERSPRAAGRALGGHCAVTSLLTGRRALSRTARDRMAAGRRLAHPRRRTSREHPAPHARRRSRHPSTCRRAS